MFQCYLELYLDSKLFCEAVYVLQTAVQEYLLLQNEIQFHTGLHQIFLGEIGYTFGKGKFT